MSSQQQHPLQNSISATVSGDSIAGHDLSASIDTLPPRRSAEVQDLFGANGVSVGGRSGAASHARQKSKTDFLDLADSTTRLGTSPDVNARLEQKRLEHERQRAEQKRAFEAQMKALQEQQEFEERELLGSVASAPTTPPRGSGGSDDSSLDGPNALSPVRSHSGNDLAAYGNVGGNTNASAFRDHANNSRSVPGSRRHSGERHKDWPVNSVGETLGLEGLSLGKDSVQTAPFVSKLVARTANSDEPSVTSFLFDDEDTDIHAFGGKYLQMNTDDDKFPILVRRDSYPGMLSASSAALDLAAPLTQTPPRTTGSARDAPSSRGTDWSPFNGTTNNAGRHPPSETDRSRNLSGTSPGFAPRGSPVSERGASPRLTRMGNLNGSTRPTTVVPSMASNVSTPPQQDKKTSFLSSAPPNGPDLSKKYPAGNDFTTIRPPPHLDQGFGSYGLNGNFDQAFGMYGGGMGGGHIGGQFGFDGHHNPYGDQHTPVFGGKQRRDMEPNRFSNIRLEDMQGDMFSLCKDQHGCRFLQKKLEDGDPAHRDMIFAEIYPHFGELMTDAFGNYLSQKLFQYSTDEQRDMLLQSISGELVSISLNMHGTRAVQKMIDFLSTQRQVQALIMALNLNVVTLIKDLNGNHVVQHVLNKLPPEDNQFVYNAVAANCIEVATHRHGCCVLQRCIDHASESQRVQLVAEITYNSLTLVQDPFGNYVLQYVLDLNDSRFIEAIVRQFLGNICALSMQKFSSNVVEKCIRVSDPAGRRAIISEFLSRDRMERLLRDSFGNYVCQTGLDYSEPAQRAEMVEYIRPILPMIRNTPYGKRIQSKIQRDSMDPPRGAAYHPALVSGGYFIAPQHMSGHPHHVPLVDGRTGASFLNAGHQLMPAHPGTIAAFPGHPAAWAAPGHMSGYDQTSQAPYAPFMG